MLLIVVLMNYWKINYLTLENNSFSQDLEFSDAQRWDRNHISDISLMSHGRRGRVRNEEEQDKGIYFTILPEDEIEETIELDSHMIVSRTEQATETHARVYENIV